jgi:alcohol-forming fatty acyl-CoA reductase
MVQAMKATAQAAAQATTQATAQAAFFDVDGTLLKSNVVDFYRYCIAHQPSIWLRSHLTARLLFFLPYYLLLDRVNRDQFNELFYQNYAGLTLEQCQTLGRQYFQEQIQPKLYPKALEKIQEHQHRGDRIVLVTGSPDFVIAPLASFLQADMLAAHLTTHHAKLTGEMQSLPVAGQEKYRLICQFAAQHQINLAASFAYGDSFADLPMLQTVGTAVAVNPDPSLQQVAQRLKWAIANW